MNNVQKIIASIRFDANGLLRIAKDAEDFKWPIEILLGELRSHLEDVEMNMLKLSSPQKAEVLDSMQQKRNGLPPQE